MFSGPHPGVLCQVLSIEPLSTLLLAGLSISLTQGEAKMGVGSRGEERLLQVRS